MYTLNDITEFVKYKTGCEDVTPEIDIESDLGCTGDDFDELMQEYSEKFKVDMNSYAIYSCNK